MHASNRTHLPRIQSLAVGNGGGVPNFSGPRDDREDSRRQGQLAKAEGDRAVVSDRALRTCRSLAAVPFKLGCQVRVAAGIKGDEDTKILVL